MLFHSLFLLKYIRIQNSVIGVESFQYPCAILIPPTAAVKSQSFWFVGRVTR